MNVSNDPEQGPVIGRHAGGHAVADAVAERLTAIVQAVDGSHVGTNGEELWFEPARGGGVQLRLGPPGDPLAPLHWGFWPDGQGADAAPRGYDPLRAFSDALLAHVPAGVTRVLDVGCGLGFNARLLAERGLRVTAVSPVPHHCALIERAALPGVEVRCARFQDLAPDGRYDLLLFSESLNHFQKGMSQISRSEINLPLPAPRAARWVVPDQLKAAVTGPCRYQPTIQRTFEEWVAHYGTVIVPARPRTRATRFRRRWKRARWSRSGGFSPGSATSSSSRSRS